MSVHTPDHEPSLFDPKPGVVDAATQPELGEIASPSVQLKEPVARKERKPRASQASAGAGQESAAAQGESVAAPQGDAADAVQESAADTNASAPASRDSEAPAQASADASQPDAAQTSAELSQLDAAAAPAESQASGEAGESSASEGDAEAAAAKSEQPSEEELPKNDRKRLAEQLDALRKKEAEILRALAITDHPDLADAIRTIEARVYCVARADAKLAQGLSKSEARRQEVLNKKLTALREKRAELDTQIAALEAEANELGTARLSDFQRERQEALQQLMIALATHDPALEAAGLSAHTLLPELSNLMPELEAIARSVSEQRADA